MNNKQRLERAIKTKWLAEQRLKAIEKKLDFYRRLRREEKAKLDRALARMTALALVKE